LSKKKPWTRRCFPIAPGRVHLVPCDGVLRHEALGDDRTVQPLDGDRPVVNMLRRSAAPYGSTDKRSAGSHTAIRAVQVTALR
jgi:hypothetical protein